jgi:hypothetical protein
VLVEDSGQVRACVCVRVLCYGGDVFLLVLLEQNDPGAHLSCARCRYKRGAAPATDRVDFDVVPLVQDDHLEPNPPPPTPHPNPPSQGDVLCAEILWSSMRAGAAAGSAAAMTGGAPAIASSPGAAAAAAASSRLLACLIHKVVPLTNTYSMLRRWV